MKEENAEKEKTKRKEKKNRKRKKKINGRENDEIKKFKTEKKNEKK